MKKKPEFLNLEEIHSALLGILVEFDRVCRENDLHYSLAYGSLLGAIRHKGFIPWDDDIDVSMPRPDYEKFYELIKSGKVTLNKHFLLAEDRGKKAEYPFLKLMDDRYSIKSRTHIEVPYLFLDIFPLDGYPDLPEKKKKHIHRKILVLNFAVDMTRWYVVDHWWCYMLRVICFWWYLAFLIWGRKNIIKKINKLVQKYPYETHKESDCTCWGYTSDPMPKTAYESYCEAEFAGHSFMVLSDWDGFLKERYGDYMTPPPPQKRMTHSMKVLRNQTEE